MDHYNRGNILNWCEKNDLSTTLSQIMQICGGLSFLHSKFNRYHGNLKPSNIFLGEDDIIKISGYFEYDFFPIDSCDFNYLSREQLTCKEITKNCDSYSLGLIIYKLITKKELYYFTSKKERIDCENKVNIDVLVDNMKCSKLLKVIILQALKNEPEDRPSVEDVYLIAKIILECETETLFLNEYRIESIKKCISNGLKINGIMISGLLSDDHCEIIKNQDNLEKLYLRECDLSEKYKTLFTNIPKCIKSLHLIGCDIDCELFKKISDNFSNLTSLIDLNVSSNSITVLQNSGNNFKYLKHLVDLNLSGILYIYISMFVLYNFSR